MWWWAAAAAHHHTPDLKEWASYGLLVISLFVGGKRLRPPTTTLLT
ncbi:hypothetical protein [Dictyobacter kobayashii]|uniref:Uncharacterized protein n=1 Tax=Dictyobacter kobayashii TaxID=2014872 RepID=A0A402APL2_9CHLR|nr:hypothetical protein [Dictyobacter kobayashii]GCE21103.1 hypothetical protein KDK_49030 [Dictyobacter kobayashii]